MENKNSVAYVGRIVSITDIAGVDRIELATVKGGWSSVVQKGKFITGQLVGVLTQDAVIPNELAEKLNIKGYLKNGVRVKTVKLKSVYSESIFINLWEVYGTGAFPVREGQDLQDYLKIYKYEPEYSVRMSQDNQLKRVENPNLIKYQKFPNAKNVSDMFKENDYVSITRKIHGTNFRAAILKKPKESILNKIQKFLGNKWAGHEFAFGSHNTQRTGYKNVYGKTVVDYDLENKLWSYIKARYNPEDIKKGFIIYGEIYGKGVQGDLYTYNELGTKVAFFDISVEGEYLDVLEFQWQISVIGLPMVAELYIGYYNDEIIKREVSGYIDGTRTPNEGIVVKEVCGNRNKVAKFINNEYLTFSDKNNIPDSH